MGGCNSVCSDDKTVLEKTTGRMQRTSSDKEDMNNQNKGNMEKQPMLNKTDSNSHEYGYNNNNHNHRNETIDEGGKGYYGRGSAIEVNMNGNKDNHHYHNNNNNHHHHYQNGYASHTEGSQNTENETTDITVNSHQTSNHNGTPSVKRADSESLSLGTSVMVAQPATTGTGTPVLISPTGEHFVFTTGGNGAPNQVYYNNVAYGQVVPSIGAYSMPVTPYGYATSHNSTNEIARSNSLGTGTQEPARDPIGHFDGKDSSRPKETKKPKKEKRDGQDEDHELATDEESLSGDENGKKGQDRRRRSSRLLRIQSVAKWDEEELNEHEEELRQQLFYLQQKSVGLGGRS